MYDVYHNADYRTILRKSHGRVEGGVITPDKEERSLFLLKTDDYPIPGQTPRTLYVKASEPLSQQKAKVQQFITENSKVMFGDAAQAGGVSPGVVAPQKPYAPFLDRKYVSRIGKEIVFYMNHLPFSFVHDGEVGSRDGAKMRVLTDSPATSLFLRHMLLKTRVPYSINDHIYDSLVIQAAGYSFTPQHILEEFAGPTPKDLHLDNEQFILTDEEVGQTTIGAIEDTDLLLDAMAHHASQTLAQNGDILLPADVVSHNNRHTLVFGNRNDMGGIYENLDGLYSAHHTVLRNDGTLSRAWNGYTRVIPHGGKFDAKSVAQNTLVEELPDGSQRVTQPTTGIVPNIIDAASSIVMLVHDKNHVIPPLARVRPEAAIDLLVSGLYSVTTEPHFRPAFSSERFATVHSKKEVRDKLQKLLFDGEMDFYIANSSVPEANAAVRLVAQNQLEDLKGRAMAGTQDLVRNISHKELSSVSRKDAAKQTQDMATLLDLAKKAAFEE